MKKSNNAINLKYEKAINKTIRVCVIISLILLYVLTVVSGLYQELCVYIMETNVSTSKTAETIIEDTYNQGGEPLDGASYFSVRAPIGTGNYVAMFNEEEVWVVSELSLAESLKQVYFFAFVDLASFIVTLYLLKTYSGRYKKLLAALCVFQIALLLFSMIVNSYCWHVLFNAQWASPAYTLIRAIVLFVWLYMYNIPGRLSSNKVKITVHLREEK